MTQKLRIIHVMSDTPPYEEYADKPRPQFNWDTKGGSWVGIWGYDWDDLLAIEMCKVDDSFMHEIWQPDLRAEKIYSKEIHPGVVHRLIPATVKKVRFGIKKVERLDWSRMIVEIEKVGKERPIVLRTHDFRLLNSLNNAGSTRKIVFSFMGDITFPAMRFFSLTKNLLSKIDLMKEHLDFMRSVAKLSAITFMNDHHVDALRRFYSGPMYKITMGVDFGRWKKLDKMESRTALGLPAARKILFMSSRLNQLKQVDRFINVLEALSRKYDVLCMISGHGTREYEARLRDMAQPLQKKGMVEFLGYVGDEKLQLYYSACDVFVLTSLSEGASVSVMKALACETPVFCTNVGNTAEVLAENGAGMVVPRKDYQAWEEGLDNILSGVPVPVLPLATARNHYHWPNIAEKFIEVFNRVV